MSPLILYSENGTNILRRSFLSYLRQKEFSVIIKIAQGFHELNLKDCEINRTLWLGTPAEEKCLSKQVGDCGHTVNLAKALTEFF